jgi:hypothetical protein
MAINFVLLAVFDVLCPTKSCSCLWCPLLATTVSACLPARQGPRTRTPRGAQHHPRHSRTRQTRNRAVRDTPSEFFCDDPDQPLTVGTPSPRVDPRCSASKFHVLCSGLQQSSDAEVARGERGSGLQKWGISIPKLRKNPKIQEICI